MIARIRINVVALAVVIAARSVLAAPVTTKAMQVVSIAVYAPRDVTDSLVSRIREEASAIWASAGISFEWHRVDSEARALEWPLDITVDDRRASAEPGGALGWIMFTDSRPEHSIHLSRACADDLVRATPGLIDASFAAHETLVGRALGRALAHELGHYLLRSKAHSSSGLMRRFWNSDDSFGLSRAGLELTTDQRAAAIAYLARNQQVPAAPSPGGTLTEPPRAATRESRTSSSGSRRSARRSGDG